MQTPFDPILGRRSLLRGFGTLGALAVGTRLGSAAALTFSAPLPQGSGNLVLLELAGGNDGLSTVAPFADDAYQKARPKLAFGKDEVVVLDDYRGLNAKATGLHEAWEAGELAIVEGCGYPEPNRSHFKSMEIWHTADLRGRDAGQGWVGRLAEAVWKEELDPNRMVHVGSDKPFSLNSDVHNAASFVLPAGYRWIDNEGPMGKVAHADEPADQGEEEAGSTLDALRRAYGDAAESSTEVRAAVAAYRPRVEYPQTDLGRALLTSAALLQGATQSRILSVRLGGFDHHNDLRRRHDLCMAELGGALSAFRRDLAGTERGDATTLLAFSEFGRRLAENGSRGADHGVAGPMFVMGPRVRGGLYGEHPSLTDLDKGDLKHTTDFRRVYADVAGSLFDVKTKDYLGKGYKKLGLLR
ncbi:MAG: DUF1501 domain-containing protein [Planctomycetota bacterium]|nr:DUF1501 domain-containing protein [Planctomycetota bacterium]